ncbi:HECT-type E3 ubiquitin transferase [Ranunculus cassubicifolius]
MGICFSGRRSKKKNKAPPPEQQSENNHNNVDAYSSDEDDGQEVSEAELVLRGLFEALLNNNNGGREGDDDIDPCTQLQLLTEACESLCYAEEASISANTAQLGVPVLVSLAKQGISPDIMLFSIRAITYLCDASPEAAKFLVENNVFNAITSPLMAIEYLDVAEQCLQALEKISRHQPLACLQAGVVMVVLNCICFFSSSYQRDGISVIANICKKLPSETSSQSLIMEAVPVLCNFLNYEDQKLVEIVCTCLIRIVKKVGRSPEMLDEICKHGLVHQAANLIALDSGNILTQQVHNGLIGLLLQLATFSINASNTLIELKISSTLKHVLCRYDLSHSNPYSHLDNDAHHQIREVVRLLDTILPPLSTNGEDNVVVSDEEKVVAYHPELLHQFGIDILPVLIQVVHSGADSYVLCGCLSVINKVLYFGRCSMLVELLNSTDISSFLAGIFTQKDHHLLMLALGIVRTVMQEIPNAFVDSFMKEGIIHVIDCLTKPDKCPKFTAADGSQGCLCNAYGNASSSDANTCKLKETSVPTLAKHIMTTYFSSEARYSEFGSTGVLQKLRNLCATLSDMVNMHVNDENHECEEELTPILTQIMEELKEEKSLSTYEFMESGIVKSLVDYLSNGCYHSGNMDPSDLSNHLHVLQKRYEVFGTLCLSSTGDHWRNMPLAILIHKLQSALSSLENFPVILNHDPEPIKTYAAIPFERSTRDSCLKVRFIKGGDDATLCEFSPDAVNVEAFVSFDAIERCILPKVSTNVCEVSAPTESASTDEECPTSSTSAVTQRLTFYLNGEQLDRTLSLYQAILQLKMKADSDFTLGQNFWHQEYELSYKKDTETDPINVQDAVQKWNHPEILSQNPLSFSSILFGEHPSTFEKSSSLYEILTLLKVLEDLNRCASHLLSQERRKAFAEGLAESSLDSLMVSVSRVPQTEFVSLKLTDKLEQQMNESSVDSTSRLPPWCVQLMEAFPFLFSFQARCEYFEMTTLYDSDSDSDSGEDDDGDGDEDNDEVPSVKFKVSRSNILESAAQIMASDVSRRSTLEVEYDEEVGTGQGPTMEFFTLVSQEFQKAELGMWREGRFGLFPCPWSTVSDELIQKFTLLGQIVAKALQDERVFDLTLSVPFYKLILGQKLNLYDFDSFDPGIGRILVEFQALVDRKKALVSSDFSFRDMSIEDLSLDFTLPGYPDYTLTDDQRMVDISNLEEYIYLTADATLNSGISKQIEAFKSGFDSVIPLKSLQIFIADELDELLCGESRNAWTYNELKDHIKFDHGYAASSHHSVEFLEIMQEFDGNQQRAFLQFVTGAPRLPPGGLAALNPKLTIVKKECKGLRVDSDLPSVMTCANYLKLPAYSSKEIMRERMLYAITEGQGSFHLS